jgi:hypothetical protein
VEERRGEEIEEGTVVANGECVFFFFFSFSPLLCFSFRFLKLWAAVEPPLFGAFSFAASASSFLEILPRAAAASAALSSRLETEGVRALRRPCVAPRGLGVVPRKSIVSGEVGEGEGERERGKMAERERERERRGRKRLFTLCFASLETISFHAIRHLPLLTANVFWHCRPADAAGQKKQRENVGVDIISRFTIVSDTY